MIWRIGQLCVTIALMLLLWNAANGPEIIHILSQAQPLWLLAAVAALISQTLLSALRWKVTAAMLKQPLPLGYAIKEYFMSQLVNQAIPGAIVGDAARAVRARTKAGLSISSQAVVFERLAGQIAMFITMACAFTATAAFEGGIDWPRAYAIPISATIGIGLTLLLIIVVIQRHPKLISTNLTRLLNPFYMALLSRHVIMSQIGLGIAITLCNLAAFGFCAWAVDLALPFTAIVTLVPVVLFSMLIPFTISGWGVREGTAALFLPLAGISPSEAVAASVLFGVVLLIAVLPGLIAVMLK